MILKTLSPDHPDVPAAARLYEESFPENERPLTMEQMLAASDELPEPLSAELLGIYSEEVPDDLAGFFFTIDTDFCTYLVYFAVAPSKRSGGIGGKAIRELRGRCGNMPLIFDFESVYEKSDNAEQRRRRRDFYLRNGFHETRWFFRTSGIELAVASSQKELDEQAFGTFRSILTTLAGEDAIELYRRDLRPGPMSKGV